MMFDDGYSLVQMGFRLMMMLIFWAGVITVAVLLIRGWSARQAPGSGSNYDRPPAARPSKAMEILKERYARGEISKPEYEEMRQALQE